MENSLMMSKSIAFYSDICPIIAIIVSSVLFGVMHFPAGGVALVIGVTLMAVVSGYIFYKFDSLWLCMIAHAVANLLEFILYNKPNFSEGMLWGKLRITRKVE